MKKSREFLGLPIISITEGCEFGNSKSLLIDAEKGAVAAIVIEDDDWYHGIKLLPYSSVIAIGQDAITITKSEDILTIDEAAEFEPLLEANIRIIDTKAITKSGTKEGIVVEFYIDEDGHVDRIVLDKDDIEIAAADISIFGKEVTIINSDDINKTDKKSVTQTAVTDSSEKKNKNVKETPVVSKTEVEPVKPEPEVAQTATKEKVVTPSTSVSAKPAPTVEKAVESAKDLPKEPTPKEPAKKVAPAVQTPTNSTPASTASNVTPLKSAPKPAEPLKTARSITASSAEDRHRRFLLGKKATRRIEADNGVLIVDEGGEITEEVLQKAELTNKLMDLSINVK